MELAAWLDSHGWTNRMMGDACGVSRETVRLWRAGLRTPSKVVAKKLRRVTRGALDGKKEERTDGDVDQLRARKRRKPRPA